MSAMSMPLRVVSGGADAVGDGFEVIYRCDGAEHQVSLADTWSVPFEAGSPVRSFPSYKGQLSRAVVVRDHGAACRV